MSAIMRIQAISLLLAFACVTPALAREYGPDTEGLVEIAGHFKHEAKVLVVTSEGSYLLSKPVPFVDGVHFDQSTRVSLTSADATADPVPWNIIRTIKVREDRLEEGAAVGMGLGLVAGMLYASKTLTIYQYDSAEGAKLYGALGALAGAGIGAGVGCLFKHWQRVYPIRVASAW